MNDVKTACCAMHMDMSRHFDVVFADFRVLDLNLSIKFQMTPSDHDTFGHRLKSGHRLSI